MSVSVDTYASNLANISAVCPGKVLLLQKFVAIVHHTVVTERIWTY